MEMNLRKKKKIIGSVNQQNLGLIIISGILILSISSITYSLAQFFSDEWLENSE